MQAPACSRLTRVTFGHLQPALRFPLNVLDLLASRAHHQLDLVDRDVYNRIWLLFAVSVVYYSRQLGYLTVLHAHHSLELSLT